MLSRKSKENLLSLKEEYVNASPFLNSIAKELIKSGSKPRFNSDEKRVLKNNRAILMSNKRITGSAMRAMMDKFCEESWMNANLVENTVRLIGGQGENAFGIAIGAADRMSISTTRIATEWDKNLDKMPWCGRLKARVEKQGKLLENITEQSTLTDEEREVLGQFEGLKESFLEDFSETDRQELKECFDLGNKSTDEGCKEFLNEDLPEIAELIGIPKAMALTIFKSFVN
jgi:hypothetical protein